MPPRHTSGPRGLAIRRPPAAFFVIVSGLGRPLMSVPLLADRAVIGTGPRGTGAPGVGTSCPERSR